jgi:DNA polymerase-1
MLAHYVFDEHRGTHDLKQLAMNYLGAPDWEADIRRYLPNSNASFALIPTSALYLYNSQDVIYTYRLYQEFSELLARPENGYARRLFYDLLMPATTLCRDMQMNGMHVSPVDILQMREVSEKREVEALKGLRETSGRPELNPGSWKQLGEVIYDEMRAPTWSFSATGKAQQTSQAGGERNERTTSKVQLERLLDCGSPRVQRFVKTLLGYREARHLRSHYLDHFEPMSDGRIHPNYALHASVTGRLASRDPNVMNMSHTNGVRGLITPEPGNVLICADYGQMELRVAAMESNDEAFKAIFVRGLNIHDTVSTWFYGPNYTKVQKVIAKSFVFGLLYGRGASSISSAFGISMQEAQEKMNYIRRMMPEFDAWREHQFRLALRQGFVETRLGRRRRFPFVTENNEHEVRRYAVNAPIQGTASDIMLIALMRINKWLPDYEGRILMPLHDSGNFEVPEEVRGEVSIRIAEEMLAAPKVVYGEECIPFVVDVEWGYSLNESTLITVDVDQETLSALEVTV